MNAREALDVVERGIYEGCMACDSDGYRHGAYTVARAALPLLREAVEQAEDVGDESPGDVITAYADGTILLDDGITTRNYRRACEHLVIERDDMLERLVHQKEQLAEERRRGAALAEAAGQLVESVEKEFDTRRCSATALFTLNRARVVLRAYRDGHGVTP